MRCERLKTLKESEKSDVYLVFDAKNRRMAVEKRLRGELGVYDRLRTLPHPYLPKIYEVRHENGETVVFEEYISGGSIAAAQASERQLERWLLELCSVLKQLHRSGIIHRDIKPSNLLLGADGHIRLIDFDAAREPKTGAERDTRLLGTKGYAPPEQYGFAQTDERADIYALGVTFRELLGKSAGKRRWRGMLNRCTALEPKRRYRHVWAIPLSVRLRKLRRRVLLPILSLYLLGLAAVAALTYFGDDSGPVFRWMLTHFTTRSVVFEQIDVAELRKSSVQLSEYRGSILDAYARLSAACPDLSLISTGYADEHGELLFGGFRARYDVSTGRTIYDGFEGLYALGADGSARRIPPADCAAYAPAVLRVYELDTFDTPLF